MTLAPWRDRDIVKLGDDGAHGSRDCIADHATSDGNSRFVHEPDETMLRMRQKELQCAAQDILAAITICGAAIQIMRIGREKRSQETKRVTDIRIRHRSGIQ